MVMEIIREGLIITPTGSLEPSQGSYDVPVKLINDETYPYYTINMYVGYYVNGVIKKRKCETDSEGHYLIPGIAFLRSGIISISFLLETADKSQGLMTNALSYEIKHAPNVVVEVPADPTWQELVKEWIQELAGAVNVDNTLTKSGMAADAKATGDAISQLSDSIANLNGGSGLNEEAKNLLITILRNAMFSNDQSENITLLENALASGSSGDNGEDEPTEPNPPTVTTYSITNNLTNVTNSNGKTTIEEKTSYSAILNVLDGYELESITVTMGGNDITTSVVTDLNILIPTVTGDVIITANAIEVPQIITYNIPEIAKSTIEGQTADGKDNTSFTTYIVDIQEGDVIVTYGNTKWSGSPWIYSSDGAKIDSGGELVSQVIGGAERSKYTWTAPQDYPNAKVATFNDGLSKGFIPTLTRG